jgi:hypothetical protein
MPLPNPKRAAAPTAVLHLTHEVAEWLSQGPNGEPSYARAEAPTSDAAELAATAVLARDTAGAGRQRCVLALGGQLVDHRVLELPELARGNLRDVLARKAAHALGTGLSDTLFAALPLALAEHAEGDGPRGQKWLMMSVRKSVLHRIEVECRRRGIELSRVTSAPLARLCEAQRVRGDVEAACIVVDVDLDSVVVSLLQGTTLRHQNRIVGTFASVATMAMALVQELRSFDAFWRRSSRGAGVTQVVVLGLDLDRSRLFATAVSAALPEARVLNLPVDGESFPESLSRADIPRVIALRPCGTGGPFALELKLALPPRPRTLFAVGAAVALVASVAGVTMKNSLSSELEDLQEQRRAHETGSAALESLEAENREAERLIGALQLEVDRLVHSRALGLAVTPTIRAVRNAVEAEAELRTISLERFDGTGEVRFGGLVTSDPVESVEVLKAIERELERHPLLKDVRIETPTFRDTGTAGAGQDFVGTAQWEERP